MARVFLSLVTRVFALLFIFSFQSNDKHEVSARKQQDLGPRNVWPNATIPYVIDCSIANVVGARKLLKAAMSEWEKRTCIRFVKRTNERGYMLVRRQKGCWGQVGYRKGSVVMSIGDGCEYKYVMMHELGHVIGFHHEHQRVDRDEFVEILWDNVLNSMLKQFYKRRKTDRMDTGLPYDSSSIMHYRLSAFTKNLSLATITLKDNSTEQPTPYSYITDLDVRKTREMYGCRNDEAKNKTSISSKKTTRIDESQSQRNDSTNRTKDEKKVKNDLAKNSEKENNKIPEETEVEVVEAVEVSLMSPGWFVTKSHERTASIMVNGKEMARNQVGLNTVVFNYLSGKRLTSIRHSISARQAGLSYAHYIKSMPKRNYFLIVSNARSLLHLQQARIALKRIGIRLPSYIAPGSSLCVVGFKGKEKVAVKYAIGSPKEKATFLAMNITLASDFRCQNDAQNCVAKAKLGRCKKQPAHYLKLCQKACGACKKGEPCQDEDPNCALWSKKLYCQSHPDYMLKYCKVSCKICRKALPARVKLNKSQKLEKKRKIVLVDDSKTKVRYLAGNNDQDEDDESEDKAIGKKCADKSETCPDWARAGRCKTDSWVIKHCLFSCDIKGSCDRQQIKPPGYCSEPFGIGWDRKLSDKAFSASSFYNTGEWNASASNARLYMEDDFNDFRIGSWCSNYPPKKGEWLKIDLGKLRKITAVATQGRFRYYEHVKTYKLSFSKNNRIWKFYQEHGRDKEFKGNCDHQSPVLNILDKTIIARYVKFHPIKYYEGICMRVEIYGCRY